MKKLLLPMERKNGEDVGKVLVGFSVFRFGLVRKDIPFLPAGKRERSQ